MTQHEAAGPGRPADGQEAAAERENDSVANKLSKELSNWRQRRTNGRSNGARRAEPSNSDFQSDVARTIKVRGHETLVVRKSKGMPKPATTQDSNR
ncbi:MAG TPA: hypothetical protein VKS22_02870 [Candidatus Binataceae bacterium]|nr:hypothetical protein [Candidatus Binataceae bacterium]